MKFEMFIKKAVLMALIVSLAPIFGCSVSEPAESIDGSGTANTAPLITEPLSTDPVSTEPTGATNPNPSEPQSSDPAPTDPAPTDSVPTDPQPTEHQHSYSTQVIRAATCFAAGETRYTCSCGSSYTEYPTRQHTYVSVGHEAPTCLEKGHDVVQCTACGDQRKWDAEAALGHAYGTWTVTIPATADQDGQERCVCTRCGDTVFRTIPKTGSTETPKTDVYTIKHFAGNRVFPQSVIYMADDDSVYGDGCHVDITDQSMSAQVEHVGYLTLKATFVDNTGETQVVIVQIGGAEHPASEYGLVSLTIKQDGSYTWSFSSHAGT